MTRKHPRSEFRNCRPSQPSARPEPSSSRLPRAAFAAGLTALLLCICGVALSQVEENPAELNQKAYALAREAQKAALQNDDRAAYDKFTEAAGLYGRIAEKFPDWNPEAIAAARSQAAAGAAAIGEKLFRLPEGYLKIQPGMSREGKRYAQGEALVPDVVKKGEDQFEIKGFIVELTRAGPLIGAHCSCPDFKYRGSKFDYACKHLWAVILKEGLLEDKPGGVSKDR